MDKPSIEAFAARRALWTTGTADDLLPAGDFDPYVRPTEESIVRFDPSEAISGYFLDPLLLSIFDVIERKELGGTLMTYLHEHVDYRLAGEHPYNMWTELAIDLESALIERGIVKSDYVFYVLREHAATSPPSTLTDALTKRDDNPLWNLESLGSVTVNEAKSQPFELLREPLVAIGGWAIDWIAKSAAGGAEIVIDGNVYAGQYGLRRRDIAEVYRGLEYLNTGYCFELKGDQFALGRRILFV